MASKSGVSEQIISSPKGGGAQHGIGEKFSPDLFTGTGNFSVPIALPPGRNGFQPQLNLVYSTGSGNGPIGLGWSLSIPGVSLKTSKGVPRYNVEKDIFILSGAEDLVPIERQPEFTRFLPRTEGLFAKITYHHDVHNAYWEVRSKDGLISHYGTPNSAANDPAVIADPARRSNIFAWKLTKTLDPFDNQIEYDYLRDQAADGPHHWDQLYLKQIRYVDYADAAGNKKFLATVSFVYQNFVDPTHPEIIDPRDMRTDAFSEYRSGFEIRSRLRCLRIIVETHTDQVRTVREYRFEYENDPYNGVSLLKRIQVIGDDAGAVAEELPPLEFGYTSFEPEGRKFHSLEGADLPARSLASPDLELADLTGDGLPDILEMNGTVRYWRNLGDGRYDLPRPMRDAPAGLALADTGVQLIDADGDGRIDLLATKDGLSGYFPLRFDGLWDRQSFRRYQYAPSFNMEDPEVKLVDLNGDGVTDVIRSGTRLECFFNDPHTGWHSDNTRWVERKALELFPNVNFSDQRVKWGDMTADGLQDIVLVYDGNVEYWPNLGWGNWGKRIHMKNSPRFRDYGYTFGYDPRRILIGDVDGDGLADIVYVGDQKVTLWINQSGNAWSDPVEIHGTPRVTDMDAVRLVDMHGTGISGVLWSADARADGRPRMFFLDFTGGVKPYLLNEMDNHMGAVTKVSYAPSTHFYLADQKRPQARWKTSLPFPVQVVARVEVIDWFSKGKLTTEYKYHHGYWDGAEREFRGFGMVEQFDTEIFNDYNRTGLHGELVDFERLNADNQRAHFFSPPTLSKSWFHQGPVGDEFGDWEEPKYEHEYWQDDPQILARPQVIRDFLSKLPRRVKRDALRVLRGSVLRTELYALDDVAPERRARPYTVTESLYGVCEVVVNNGVPGLTCEPQPGDSPERLGADFPQRIFFPHLLAQRTTQWERGADPLTQFAFTGDYDKYGQARSQISMAVPRHRNYVESIPAGASAPEKYLATHTLTDFAQRDDANCYIVDRVARATTYEISNDGRDDLFGLKNRIESKALDQPANIISQTLNFYDRDPLRNDMGAFVGLPFGQIGKYGALARSESLVLTDNILQAAYDANRPLYLERNPSANWKTNYPQEFGDRLAAQPRLAGYAYQPDANFAQGYFIATQRCAYDFHVDPNGAGRGLILAQRGPLGQETIIAYDPYSLLPIQVKEIIDPTLPAPADALTTKAEYDYRVLQPRLVTDPNGNQTGFVFTPLGLLKETWARGKPAEAEGDRQRPGTRMEYDFLAAMPINPADRKPIFVRTLRHIHHDTETDIAQPQRDEMIETREYSDGFGRLLQARTQGENVRFGDEAFGGGEAVLPANQSAGRGGNVVGKQNTNSANPNVVVSGWQTYDNKGGVVEKYEPFFSTGWEYAAPADALLGRSQKATLHYDPRGQVIRTVNPDGSEQRVIYGVPADLTKPDMFASTPWETYAYDANDLAPLSVRPDGTSLVGAAPNNHHFTPTSAMVDALGRIVRTVERNGPNLTTNWYITISTYDIRGNLLVVTDALGREAFKHTYDLANRLLRIVSIDAGDRCTVPDAAGNVLETRDSKGALSLHAHDRLNRPIRLWARDGAGQSLTLRERLFYGDQPNLGSAQNLRGKVYQHYDEAGLLTFETYDFKGNLLQKARRTIRDTSIANGWQANWGAPGSTNALEPANQAYQTSTRYDALNRPKQVIYPKDVNGHRPALKPIYNRAGTLEKVELDGAMYVERIAYNAKGQRTLIAYGNGAMTRYAYDEHTFRLARLRTEAYTHPGSLTYRLGGSLLQDFAYEYDLAGNILRLTDILPGCGVRNNPEAPMFPELSAAITAGDALVRRFVYDPLYRLVSATGREAQNSAATWPSEDFQRKGFNWGLPNTPSPETARDQTQIYTETYAYDPAGNMLSLAHGGRWSRNFGMAGFTPRQWKDKVADFLSGGAPAWGTNGNQLTNVGAENQIPTHAFDTNGNLKTEATDRHFIWNHADQLIEFTNQATPTSTPSVKARYLYDAAGMRVKKWVRTNGTGPGDSSTYIDGIFEYHRWKEVGQPGIKQNNCLHVMDNQGRIAIKRVGDKHSKDAGPNIQYHLGDHLGSSSIVLGGATATGDTFMNREEFFPYGETSFGCFGRKRYRHTGKERDEESGLNYHGMRYYAPWLTKWINCDPAGRLDGNNLFTNVSLNPIRFVDKNGLMDNDAPSAMARFFEASRKFSETVESNLPNETTPTTAREKSVDRDIDTLEHDKAVVTIVNAAIDAASQQARARGVTLSGYELLRNALFDFVTPYRSTNGPQMSQNLVLRDVDHYLVGRIQEWRRELPFVSEPPGPTTSVETILAGQTAAFVYDFIKELSFRLSPEQDKPNAKSSMDANQLPASAPGGRFWAMLGAIHLEKRDKPDQPTDPASLKLTMTDVTKVRQEFRFFPQHLGERNRADPPTNWTPPFFPKRRTFMPSYE